jgi:HSP20 family protein
MPQQWNPLQDLMVLRDRMNSLFEDATQRRARAETESGDEIERAEWYPAADVYENESEYLLALDLPGIDRSALDISIDDNRLAIRGTRSIAEENERRSERPRGRFVRTFGIPGAVDQQQIQAEYKDGVLRLHLPKRQEQKTQRLEIKVS